MNTSNDLQKLRVANIMGNAKMGEKVTMISVLCRGENKRKMEALETEKHFRIEVSGK